MKAFLVLPFLFLLFGSSQESAIDHQRSVRGVNTTLHTNFNGTFQRKNPCTNADVETSSYVASHEFHHHIKEDSWSDYLHKCCQIIGGFLQGIGKLVKCNSEQNGSYNFQVNTSISQIHDGEGDGKPTIIIETETYLPVPPSCNNCPKVHDDCLSRQIPENDFKASVKIQPGDECDINVTPKQDFCDDMTLPETQNYPYSTPIISDYETTPQSNEKMGDNQYRDARFGQKPFFGDLGKEIPDQASPLDFENESVRVEKPVGLGEEMIPPERFQPADSQFNPQIYDKLPQTESTDGRFINPTPYLDQQYKEMADVPPQNAYSNQPETYPIPPSVDYLTPEPAIPEFSESKAQSFPDVYIPTTKQPFVEKFPTELPQNYPEEPSSYPDVYPKPEEPINDFYNPVFPEPRENQKIQPSVEQDWISTTVSPPESFTMYDTQFSDEDVLKNKPSSLIPNEEFYIKNQSPSPKEAFLNEKATSEYESEFTEPLVPTFSKENSKPQLIFESLTTYPPATYPEGEFNPEVEELSFSNIEKSSQLPKETFEPIRTPFVPKTNPENNFYPSDYPSTSIPVFNDPQIQSEVFEPKSPVSVEPGDPTFFNIKNSQSPRPTPESMIHEGSQASPEIYENQNSQPFVPNFTGQNPKAQSEVFEPVIFPKNNFNPSDNPSNKENLPISTSEPIVYSEPSSNAFAKTEGPGFTDFENLGPQPRPTPEPISYSEASSQAFAEAGEPGFNEFENPNQRPRGPIEENTTPLPPVTYPEGDYYTSDYPSSENPPISTSEFIDYSEASSHASSKIQMSDFSIFENHNEDARGQFEGNTTPLPSVTYPADYSSTLENPSTSNFEPTAYSEASSQAFAGSDEPRFLNFDNSDQQRRGRFEENTTPFPPVTYPENDYSSDYPSSENPRFFIGQQTQQEAFEANSYAGASSQASTEAAESRFNNFENADLPPRPTPEPISYSEASSQAFAKAGEPGFNEFENPNQRPSGHFEEITTPLPPVPNPEGDYYTSGYPSSENPPISTSEFIDYSDASSQASTRIQNSDFSTFENSDQQAKGQFKENRAPLQLVPYPEGDYYPSDYPPTSENPRVFNGPGTQQEAFEANSYAGASSQASTEAEESRFNNFENADLPPRPTPEPIGYSEASSQAFTNTEGPGFTVYENLGPQPRPTPEPIAYSEASSHAFAGSDEPRFLNPDNSDQQPRGRFEENTTPFPPVTYPENDYSSDYPSSENPRFFIGQQTQQEAFEANSYAGASSQASTEAAESRFNNFENANLPPRPTPEPVGYSEASSQAFAGSDEPGFNEFENPNQRPSGHFEEITTPLPPVPNPDGDYYTSGYPSSENPPISSSEFIDYSEASSQASANIQTSDFSTFENRNQQATGQFEEHTTPLPRVAYPSDYPSTLENPSTSNFESIDYSDASSQASTRIQNSDFSTFENSDQQAKRQFEENRAPLQLVPYPEGDYYPSDYPPTSENPRVFNDPGTQQEAFDANSYAGASSQASVFEQPNLSNFGNPNQPLSNQQPTASIVQNNVPLSPATYPVFYPSNYAPAFPINPSASTFAPTAYSPASSQISAQKVQDLNSFYLGQQSRQSSEANAYAEGSSQASVDAGKPGLTAYSQTSATVQQPNFSNEGNLEQKPGQTSGSIAFSQASSGASATAQGSDSNSGNSGQKVTSGSIAFSQASSGASATAQGSDSNTGNSGQKVTSGTIAFSQASATAQGSESNSGNSGQKVTTGTIAFSQASSGASATAQGSDSSSGNSGQKVTSGSIAFSQASSGASVTAQGSDSNSENSDQKVTTGTIAFSQASATAQGSDSNSGNSGQKVTSGSIAFSQASSGASATAQGSDSNTGNSGQKVTSGSIAFSQASSGASATAQGSDSNSGNSGQKVTSGSIAFSQASSGASATAQGSDSNSENSDQKVTTGTIAFSQASATAQGSDSNSGNSGQKVTSGSIAFSQASSGASATAQGSDSNTGNSGQKVTSGTIAFSQASATAQGSDSNSGNSGQKVTSASIAFSQASATVEGSDSNSGNSGQKVTSGSIAHSQASSQASANAEKQGVMAYSQASATAQQPNFSKEGYPEQNPGQSSGAVAYSQASSQAFSGADQPRLFNFENSDQQPRGSFEGNANPFPPVTYPEDHYYTSDYPPISENPTINYYSEASSQASAEVEESASNGDEQSRTGFEKSMGSKNEDFFPTTQSPESLSFSSSESRGYAQSEPILPNGNNRPAPIYFPPLSSSQSQSDLPLDYYEEEIPKPYPEQPFDDFSVPQPEYEELTTPPSYQDYTPGEEPFIGDSTQLYVDSKEKMPNYSPPPFAPEPQPQPSYDIPGDNILPSETFENSKTTNQYPVTSFQNLDTQQQSTISTTDFVTTPASFANIPSFQTPPRSKPEEIMTNSQENPDAQETLLFGDNVSPQPQPTTAVKLDEGTVTTEYQTSPALKPQPQTTMNYANQHSDDNPNGELSEFFTDQQHSQSQQLSSSESLQQTVEPTQNSYLPYNNQLRSKPIYPQPLSRQQEPLINSPNTVNPIASPLMASRIPTSSIIQPQNYRNDEWMSNERVPNNFRQVPPERVSYPKQNYNIERLFPKQFPNPSRTESSPNFPAPYEPRRSDFYNTPRQLITDSQANSYNPPPSFDSSNHATTKTEVEKESKTTTTPTAITESTIQTKQGYPDILLNNKRFPEQVRKDRRFGPSEDYRDYERQQFENFYGGFPPNASYSDYGQRANINPPFYGQDYPEYDQLFPNPPPKKEFVYDEINQQKATNRQFDQSRPERQYFTQTPQRLGTEEQQHPNPVFQPLTTQMEIPLQKLPPPKMPNGSYLPQRNYFRDSPGWQQPNSRTPQFQSQSASALTDPSNNPDRTTNGRINYMDRPLQKPFYADRTRPVSTPVRRF